VKFVSIIQNGMAACKWKRCTPNPHVVLPVEVPSKRLILGKSFSSLALMSSAASEGWRQENLLGICPEKDIDFCQCEGIL
jgi:hypothetical protein